MKETSFPYNIYKADIVHELPYYYRDIINPATHFEYDMNRVPRTPNAQIPARWGWNTGHKNGYGIGNIQFDKNCPRGCVAFLEGDPQGYVTQRTMDIFKKYKCMRRYSPR